tara:strand:- start:140 stop:346 length:207 start_codon:yes stop_codon:yes gene_type:complete
MAIGDCFMLDYKNKTGLSEVQWLQVFGGGISVSLWYFGYQELAIHAGAGATMLLGVLGAYLRRKQKAE